MSHPRFKNPMPPENAAQARAYFWNEMMAANTPSLLALQKQIREFCTAAPGLNRTQRIAGYKKLFSEIQQLIKHNASNYVSIFLQNYWSWQVKDHLKENKLSEEEYQFAAIAVLRQMTSNTAKIQRKLKAPLKQTKRHGKTN